MKHNIYMIGKGVLNLVIIQTKEYCEDKKMQQRVANAVDRGTLSKI